ncbi:MAG: DUF4760 domain-containing protein [Terriglobales bacterium]
MAKQKKASATDAQLILQLYDLRREAEMRKARNFYAMQFNPQSFDDVVKVVGAFGSDENRWFRQLVSYWEMAASLVLRGAAHEELFLDSAGEMFFVFSKIKPFLAELRKKFDSPEFLGHMDKLIHRSAENRRRLKVMEERMAQFAKMRVAGTTEKREYGT